MEDGFKLAQHTQKKRNKIKTFTTRQRQPTLSAVFIASTQLSVSRFSQFTDGPVSEGRLTLLHAFLTAIFDRFRCKSDSFPLWTFFLHTQLYPLPPDSGIMSSDWMGLLVVCVWWKIFKKNKKQTQNAEGKRRAVISTVSSAPEFFLCVCVYNQHARRTSPTPAAVSSVQSLPSLALVFSLVYVATSQPKRTLRSRSNSPVLVGWHWSLLFCLWL